MLITLLEVENFKRIHKVTIAWIGVTVRHRKRKDAIASAVGVAIVMNKREGIDCDLPYYDDRGACWSGANCQKARRYSGSFEVGA